MSSSLSLSPDQTFQNLAGILGQVQREDESRLLADAEALGFPDLAEVWDRLQQVDPSAFVEQWRETNPSLSLSLLANLNRYKVAVGILRVLSPEPL